MDVDAGDVRAAAVADIVAVDVGVNVRSVGLGDRQRSGFAFKHIVAAAVDHRDRIGAHRQSALVVGRDRVAGRVRKHEGTLLLVAVDVDERARHHVVDVGLGRDVGDRLILFDRRHGVCGGDGHRHIDAYRLVVGQTDRDQIVAAVAAHVDERVGLVAVRIVGDACVRRGAARVFGIVLEHLGAIVFDDDLAAVVRAVAVLFAVIGDGKRLRIFRRSARRDVDAALCGDRDRTLRDVDRCDHIVHLVDEVLIVVRSDRHRHQVVLSQLHVERLRSRGVEQVAFTVVGDLRARFDRHGLRARVVEECLGLRGQILRFGVVVHRIDRQPVISRARSARGGDGGVRVVLEQQEVGRDGRLRTVDRLVDGEGHGVARHRVVVAVAAVAVAEGVRARVLEPALALTDRVHVLPIVLIVGIAVLDEVLQHEHVFGVGEFVDAAAVEIVVDHLQPVLGVVGVVGHDVGVQPLVIGDRVLGHAEDLRRGFVDREHRGESAGAVLGAGARGIDDVDLIVAYLGRRLIEPDALLVEVDDFVLVVGALHADERAVAVADDEIDRGAVVVGVGLIGGVEVDRRTDDLKHLLCAGGDVVVDLIRRFENDIVLADLVDGRLRQVFGVSVDLDDRVDRFFVDVAVGRADHMGEAVVADLGRHVFGGKHLSALAVVDEPVQRRERKHAYLLDDQPHLRGEVEVVVVVFGEVAAAVFVQFELDPFGVLGGIGPFGDDLDRVDGDLVVAARVEHPVLAADVGIAEVEVVAEAGADVEVDRERHRVGTPIGRRDRVRVGVEVVCEVHVALDDALDPDVVVAVVDVGVDGLFVGVVVLGAEHDAELISGADVVADFEAPSQRSVADVLVLFIQTRRRVAVGNDGGLRLLGVHTGAVDVRLRPIDGDIHLVRLCRGVDGVERCRAVVLL